MALSLATGYELLSFRHRMTDIYELAPDIPNLSVAKLSLTANLIELI